MLGSMLTSGAIPFALCAVLSVFAPAARADAFTTAVLPVMAPDLLEPQRRAIDERIRAVAADSGVALQPADETARGIDKAKKAGAACNIESLACQAQMGVLLGTQQVVVARVTSDFAGDKLELRLLDALRGTTLREATQRLPAEGELRARVTDGAILSVLAPEKTGALVIKAGEGAVFLDGVALTADVARARIEGLAPGPHDVELRVEGKPALHEVATVESGTSAATVTVGAPAPSAGPAPDKPEAGPSMGLWLVGGGAALAAAAGAGAGGLQAALEYSAMERNTRSALQVTGLSLLGATAVGVVVAGAGGVMMALDGGQP